MKPASSEELTPYFSGDRLYGDDFDSAAIQQWFADEAEGYADLGARDRQAYRYAYHGLNWIHGFRYLDPNRQFTRVMGFGSAYGDELLPIASRAGAICIVDPSDAFRVDCIESTPVSYFKPMPDGRLPFDDGRFDLITCLGVLHHIPNVTFVMREFSRCLSPNGIVLLREPTTSMGDWRKPRRGLTHRERGIPVRVVRAIAQACALNIVRESNCCFPLSTRFWRVFGVGAYNSRFASRLDHWIAEAFAWNYSYHRLSLWKKMAPTSAFWMLQK